jgi:stage V sporulation protein G
MQITEVKVFPVKEEKLKAFVSIVIDDCFMVNDIKIIRGRDGRFISMPSRRKKNGDFKDVAHPLNNETRRELEDRILAEYDRVRGAREGGEPEMSAASARAADATREDLGEPESAPVAAEPDETKDGRTLKEIADRHLSDSFWST